MPKKASSEEELREVSSSSDSSSSSSEKEDKNVRFDQAAIDVDESAGLTNRKSLTKADEKKSAVFLNVDNYVHDPSRVAGADANVELDAFEAAELRRAQARRDDRLQAAEDRDKELLVKIRSMREEVEKAIDDEVRIDLANRNYQHPETHVHGDHKHKEEKSVVAGKQKRSFIIYFFLMIVGIITAVIGLSVDLAAKQLRWLHIFIVDFANPDKVFTLYGYALWIGYGLLIAWLAATWTDKWSPSAVGSGIPELKCFLNGADTISRGATTNKAKEFLSAKTFVSKVVGLTLAIGSGMWVGKEGPYVHTSAIIVNQLFRFFPILGANLRGNTQLRLQLLGAAVGIGVASHFGAVLGGVLFSIEVTSTYYPVRNYWYAAVGCGVGGIAFRTLHNIYNERAPLSSVVLTAYADRHDFAAHDIGFFLFIGLSCGIISALFTHSVLAVINFRKTHMANYRLFVGPIGFTCIVVVVVSAFSFPHLWGEQLQMGGYALMQDLCNADSLGDGKNATVPIVGNEWVNGHGDNIQGLWKNLMIFFFFRLLLTPFTITSGVPAGLFVPTLLLGAAWGRLLGEAANMWADDPNYSTPGGYAIAGAAAMTGGITQTFSTSIIVLEMTGQLVFSLPCFLATTLSIMIVRLFNESIFDEISKAKSLQFFDELRYWRYEDPASRIMKRDFMFLTRKMNLRAVVAILEARPERMDFPVLRSIIDDTLVGMVERKALEDLVYEPIRKSDESQRQYWFNTTAIKRTLKPVSVLNQFVELDAQDVPFQLLPTTKLYAIHVLFITLRLKTVFITERGKLRGIIGRNRLQSALAHPEADGDELARLAGDR